MVQQVVTYHDIVSSELEKNLVIERLTASTVRLYADRLAIEGIVVEGFDDTLDIALATDRDGFTEAANQWVALWAMATRDGTTVRGMLSASGTAPTLPAGFTRKNRVGWLRNDASSNFLDLIQHGRFALYREDEPTVTVQSALLTTTFADVDCASFIPPGTRQGWFKYRFSSTGSAAAGTTVEIFARPNGSALAEGYSACLIKGPNQQGVATEWLWLDANRVFEAKLSSTTGISSNKIIARGWLDIPATPPP